MKTYFLITGMLFFVPFLSGMRKPNCVHTENTFRCVEFVKNYDGDTVTFNIKNVHWLIGKEIPIRVYGIDTAEIRTKNKCEGRSALLAKKMVNNFLRKASYIELRNVRRGKYFRIVADVYANNQSLAEYLLKYHMAVRYDGGTKKRVDWCNYKGDK